MANNDLWRSPTPEAAKPTPLPKKKDTPHSNKPLGNPSTTANRGSKDLGVVDSHMQPPKSDLQMAQDKNFGRFLGSKKILMISVRRELTSKISSIAEEETDAPIDPFLLKMTIE